MSGSGRHKRTNWTEEAERAYFIETAGLMMLTSPEEGHAAALAEVGSEFRASLQREVRRRGARSPLSIESQTGASAAVATVDVAIYRYLGGRWVQVAVKGCLFR